VHELIDSDSWNETETRSICFELVIGSYRIAREIGDPMGRYFGSEKKMWKQILDCEGTIQLLQVTRSILAEFCEFISQRKKSHYSLIVQRALEFMQEHFSEDLSLQDVAQKVYLSPSYLGALLRSELGRSFTEQLTVMRMNKAKGILVNPRCKLYEVADSVGYKNPAYFAALFKRHVGMSPTEYRDSLGK
jgi:two-component system response regulator YesN